MGATPTLDLGLPASFDTVCALLRPTQAASLTRLSSQSISLSSGVSTLSSLEKAYRRGGLATYRCNGASFGTISAALQSLRMLIYAALPEIVTPLSLLKCDKCHWLHIVSYAIIDTMKKSQQHG